METRTDIAPGGLGEAHRQHSRPATVYTYYHRVPEIDEAEQQAQMAVWEASWRRHGWEPVILGRQQAWALGPQTDEAEKVFLARPTYNPRAYTLATYLRWFALKARGGGLMTDYDVVNVDFRPETLKAHVAGRDCVCLCACWVPAVVYANPAGCERIVSTLLGHQVTEKDTVYGRPHISDMPIFQKNPPGACVRVARLLDEPDKGEPLVHCANACLAHIGRRGQRAQVMKEVAGV